MLKGSNGGVKRSGKEEEAIVWCFVERIYQKLWEAHMVPLWRVYQEDGRVNSFCLVLISHCLGGSLWAIILPAPINLWSAQGEPTGRSRIGKTQGENGEIPARGCSMMKAKPEGKNTVFTDCPLWLWLESEESWKNAMLNARSISNEHRAQGLLFTKDCHLGRFFPCHSNGLKNNNS